MLTSTRLSCRPSCSCSSCWTSTRQPEPCWPHKVKPPRRADACCLLPAHTAAACHTCLGGDKLPETSCDENLIITTDQGSATGACCCPDEVVCDVSTLRVEVDTCPPHAFWLLYLLFLQLPVMFLPPPSSFSSCSFIVSDSGSCVSPSNA